MKINSLNDDIKFEWAVTNDSLADLERMRANCHTTYLGTAWEDIAEKNWSRVERIDEEFRNRGKSAPSNDVDGMFNGRGAFLVDTSNMNF